ncbi:MAG: hypothetical protein AAFY99_07315 [Pseudomonadota bacterium]
MKLPLQNRVSPFGDIIATQARGTLTGNRGIIHDPDTRRLLPRRRWSSRAWIYCRCDFKNRKRDVFGRNGRNGGPGWTNLFFLDEATALAAGHRPCFYCQRTRANEFKAAWESAFGRWPGVQAVDAVLHAQRLNSGQKRLHRLPPRLPKGVMLALGANAFTHIDEHWFQWHASGYEKADTFDPEQTMLITPPAITKTILAGFSPKVADMMVSGDHR